MSRITAVFCTILVALVAATPAFSQTISYLLLADEVGSGLQTSSARARLSDDQHGGITVRIESADPAIALVTADELAPGATFVDVFVANGATDAFFYVQALEDTTGTVLLTATATGFSDGVDSIDVVVPALRLSGLAASHDPFDIDDQFIITVGVANAGNTGLSPSQKVRVGGPGLTATITNSSAPIGQLVTAGLTGQVAAVAITPGETSSPNTVAAGGVAFDGLVPGTTDVDATIPGFNPLNTIPQTVTVTAPVVTFTFLPDDLGAGLQEGGKRVRLSGREHGGVTVHLESSDATKVLLAVGRYDVGTPTLDLFIADGALEAFFHVQALEATTGSAVVTASAPGFAAGASTVNVLQPYFGLSGLNGTTDTIDPVDAFTIRLGLPNGAMTTISPSQQARGGGPGITAIVTSSDETVGLLETTSTLDDTATVFIAPGESASPGSVAAGGVAFDGIAAGMTTVTASLTGFLPVTAGIVDVTVTQPSISFSFLPSVGVGSGLQPTSTIRVNLSASQHGGTTVTVSTLDTLLVLISPAELVVGTSSTDIFIPNGLTQGQFYLQGLEDTTGVATLTASAPGFVSAVVMEDVVQPSIRISNSLTGSQDTLDPPDPFAAHVGVTAGPNFSVQDVRAGSPGLVVSAKVDDALVAELQTLGATGDSVTVAIPAGSYFSASTVAGGGVAFNGLTPGVVDVSVSAAGFIQFSTAIKTVTVTSPTINMSTMSDVPAGLQLQESATLSASGHGGVTVHIESERPGLALVSDGASNPGQAAVDIFLADGSVTAQYWVHGVDDTTGVYVVTVSAPFFITDSDSADVVQPGVEIASLAGSIDAVDPPDQFYARVGLTNGDNSDVNVLYDRRAGQPPLAVSIISSNGAAAELNTTSEMNDTVTVLIAAGDNRSPTTIAAGGVGLNGLASGQTVVSAELPGFITTGNGQVVVDVTNQNLFINGLTTRLGAGLQSVAVSAELGEPLHGGTTVHIEVSDTTLGYISGNALVQGGEFIDVVLPNGDTEAVFYLQARYGVSGQVDVTATANTFATVMQNVDIVAAGIEVFDLADTIPITDPDDEFVVRVGAVNVDSTGIFEPQALRGGGGSRTINVASSDGGLAFIVLGNGLDASADYVMDPGEFETPLTVVQGGLALTPWNVGQINVTASTSGFVTTDAGMPLVALTGTPIGIGDQPTQHVFRLEQNQPNPFNPTTTIGFSVPTAGPVRLEIFDVAGRRVATLVDREMSAGVKSMEWNARNQNGRQVPSGVYFYRLVAGPNVQTRKMVLLK